MKPIVLDLVAFGPFAGKQRIDFRELGAQSFFLIHGPTGSGKTSILDGIAFALYGDSSGGEREARQMRSHHADPATLTEITLDFSLGESCYRVHRVPEQMRPARRGGGETKQNPQASLWRIDADGGAGNTEVPLAAGWSDVTRHIVRLLGFESRQFRQVIMLPQGRFREFLSAGSAEREKILQTLFGTELYRRVEEALKESARALEREAETVRARRQALLDQAGVADEATLATRVGEQQAALAAAQNAELTAAALAQAEQIRLGEARVVAERFAEFDAAAAAHAEFVAAQPGWAMRRAEFAAAARAAAIAPLARAAAEARRQRDDEGARQQALTQALALARERQSVTAAALAAEEAKSPQRASATADLAAYDALALRVAALASLRDEVGAADSAARLALAALAARRKAVGECADARALAHSALDAARLAAAGLAGLLAEANQAEALLARRDELAQFAAAKEIAGRTLVSQTQALAAADAERGAARAGRDATAAAWLAGQAARLAQSLHAGEACPVCGAREHPLPAGGSAAKLVSDRQLNDADARLAAAETKFAAAQGAFLAAQQALALNAARSADLERALGDAAAKVTALPALRATLQSARERLQLAQRAAGELPAREAAFAAAVNAHAGAENAQLAAEAAAQHAQAIEAQLAGQYRERAANIPEKLASPAALAAASSATRGELARLEQALAVAVSAARESGEALASAQARLAESGQALVRQTQAAIARDADFGAALASAGFADAAQWTAASRDEAQIAALELALRDNDNALAAASERRARAAAAVDAKLRPPLPALQEACELARAGQIAAARAVQDVAAALAGSRQFAATIDALASEHGALEARYGVLRHVADAAGGNNPQRLSLQRYVLATLLEQVLAATTQRLSVMSRGRYEMRRREAPIDQRAAAGLDLEVFDQHTGSTRAVATLSGGESFLASLALALGLSDVVQSAAGGIRLDAIFVDEGFGTLDPEALDAAIRALKDLQQAGRMVGIISHVAELKEWIAARLELIPGPRGSVARFSR